MKKKWIIVLAVALAAVLLVVIVAAIALRDQNTEQPGGTSSGEQTSSSQDLGSQDAAGDGEGKGENTALTYAEFLAMTPDQQDAFKDSFATGADYVAWFWAAYDAWEAEQDADKIIIDGNNPVIDAGQLIGGNS